jgi:hypothetical protein
MQKAETGDKEPMTKISTQRVQGQSLVELALIFPILFLVLIAGVGFGLGLYQANIASGAIQQPALKKLEMADNPNAISSETVLGWVTKEGTKGNILGGKAVDSVSFVSDDPELALVVGTKEVHSIASFLPDMNITVVQGLNKNLLLAADAGAKIKRPAKTAWVPGGTPRLPPWKNPILGKNVPPDLQVNPNCESRPVSPSLVSGINDDEKIPRTYLSNVSLNLFSRVKPSVLLQMANDFEAACAGAGAGVCEQEEKDLQTYPESSQGGVLEKKEGTPPDPVTYYYKITNPPGGPGTILTYTITCQGNPPQCGAPVMGTAVRNSALAADHGMYYDPAGKYDKLPEDFVSSCKARKKAECKLIKAVEKAEAILTAYPDPCP